MKELVQHGEEKLFIMLKHHYIRTSAGRAMAVPLHEIMLNEVCAMLQDKNEEVQRLVDTYTEAAPPAAAGSSNPAASPAPNSQTTNDTPGTAATSSSSSSSSSSSFSSEPKKKKLKIVHHGRGGSWHNPENTTVIKNGMITGITPALTEEEVLAMAEKYRLQREN